MLAKIEKTENVDLVFSDPEGVLDVVVAAEAIALALQQPGILQSGKTVQSESGRRHFVDVVVNVGVVAGVSRFSVRQSWLSDKKADPRRPELHLDGHGLEGEESDPVGGQRHSEG